MGFFGGGGGGITYGDFVGATTSTAGTAGLVPAPAAGTGRRVLKSTATFEEVPILPEYKNDGSGMYIGTYTPAFASGSFAPATRRRYFALTYAPADGVIDLLSARVAAPSGTPTATNIHIGAWTCADNGRPGTYITGGTASSGTLASTIINISVSTASISMGFFYLGFTTESTTVTTGGTLPFTAFSTQTAQGYMLSFTGSSGFPGVTSPNQWHYTAATYDQQTHETFTTAAPSGGAINLGFQYV